MSKLIPEIKIFEEKSKAHLMNKWNNAKMQIEQQISNYEKFIKDSDIAAALIDLDKLQVNKLDELKRWTTVPQLLRFGNLVPENKNGKLIKEISIPLILPYTEDNAFLFDMGNNDVPALFQTVALRFLLTMKLKVCKIYFIDSNFGNSFSLFRNIKNDKLECKIICEQEEVNQLISYLGKTIKQANYLGTHINLTNYNSTQSGLMAQPYHFVFINDFPNEKVFSKTTLDNLYSLIDNNNAARAGIHFFINYSEKNSAPRDFDINRFKNICACINTNANNDTAFTNWGKNIALPKFKINLEMTLPKNKIEVIKFINKIEEKETLSLDGWIEDLKKSGMIWKGTTVDGINVPIGFISAEEKFNFYLANDNDGNCNDFFALIAGRPGFGKTVFLDNIIVNSCFKYPPDELQLFLADFKNGISFKKYRDLPHAKTIMLADNREYALRMLQYLIAEKERRSKLFDHAQKQFGKTVEKFADYRKITGEKLPRILLIMDEFQSLFQGYDVVTEEAKNNLIKGVREWRALGISIILCTQDLQGVKFGDADTKITYRFALNLLEYDSKSIIRNNAAQYLKEKGQTIMNNTADGNVQSNVEFQCAYTQRSMDHVNFLAEFSKNEKCIEKLPIKYICESGTDADIKDNATLLQQFENDKFPANNNYCDVFVGKPDLLRDTHTRIRYRRQNNSNTIIIGDDYKTAINTIATNLIQIQKQSVDKSIFYVVDCCNASDEFKGALNCLHDYSQDIEIVNPQSIDEYINKIDEKLQSRKQANTQGQAINERIVLSIFNIQNCEELRPQAGQYGPTPSPSSIKLAKILNEGAQMGIHCIVHTLSYDSLMGNGKIFDAKVFDNFENKVFLKGADIQKIYLPGLKIAPVENNGQMVVLNAKVDNENYEQCNAYTKITTGKKNKAIDFFSKLFNRHA